MCGRFVQALSLNILAALYMLDNWRIIRQTTARHAYSDCKSGRFTQTEEMRMKMEMKMERETDDLLFDLARPYLTVRLNQEHTEICYLFARELQEKLGGSKEIIFPAIILHDVGWSAVLQELLPKAFGPKSDPGINRIHEIEGAKIAAVLLQQVPLDDAVRQEICRIIESHDSGSNPHTLEEKIVKDADKLFRFSSRGFAIDVERFNVDAGEYWHFLDRVKEQWFFTPVGKEIAGRELDKISFLLDKAAAHQQQGRQEQD